MRGSGATGTGATNAPDTPATSRAYLGVTTTPFAVRSNLSPRLEPGSGTPNAGARGAPKAPGGDV